MRLSLFTTLIAFTKRAVTVGAYPMVPLPLDTRNVDQHEPETFGHPLNRVAVVASCVVFAFILAFVQGKYSVCVCVCVGSE